MKKQIYPKTTRFSDSFTIITEKLDGSNLWIFRLNWEIMVATRSQILKISEIKKWNYKGLKNWLEENLEKLDLHEGSLIFWEWLGMWHIKYSEVFDKKFYMFAKANIDENFEIKNLNYYEKFFIYPFESQKIPECIWVVPVVAEVDVSVNLDFLNHIYEEYKKEEKRNIEWFIIIERWKISKYVRHKNWKETEHLI